MGGPLGIEYEILFPNRGRGVPAKAGQDEFLFLPEGYGDGSKASIVINGDVDPNKVSRWVLRDYLAGAVQAFRHNHRMVDCHSKLKKRQESADIRVAGDRAWFRGQWQCGCIFTCPICAPRIAEVRRREIKQGVDYALSQGMGVTLVTLTQRHSSAESLMDSVERYAKSLKSLKSGRAYASFRKEFGILGEIRTLEVTYGENGWHVHTHSIVISNAQIKGEDDIARMKDALFVLWYLAQSKYGDGKPSHRHGVDVKPARYVADYIAKWGFAEELTKGHLKRGWGGGRTPWQLAAHAMRGCTESRALWLEFAAAFEDRRQLLWSPGLKQRLGLRQEITDQEALDLEPEEEVRTAATIDYDTYAVVVRSNAFEVVLDAARRSPAELFGLLNRLRSEVEMSGGPPPGPREDWGR